MFGIQRPFAFVASFIFGIFLATLATTLSFPKDALLDHPNLRINKTAVTISGFSSGAAMASQFHVSHSRIFSGIGIFAGVYYRCSGDTRNKTYCFLEEGNKVETSIENAIKYQFEGLVDPLENLSHQKVYIWLGTKDEQLAHIRTRLQNVNFYQQFIPHPNNIFTKVQASTHLVPSSKVNQSCETVTALPNKYLENCNYSGAYEMFKFLLGPSIKLPSGDIRKEPLRKFNLAAYSNKTEASNSRLDATGFYYIPKNCLDGSKVCYLHMFLHGCGLTNSSMKTRFIEQSGFLEVAEQNDIALIFPQILVSKENPKACWDTDGRIDINYANKNGMQIQHLKNILESLMKTSDSGKSSAGETSKTTIVIILCSVIIFL